MFLAEPQKTPYDLTFSVAGIPVRVTPWFWLACLVLAGNDRAREPKLLLMWTAVLFVSILIHEMGHALAFRYFRIPSRITLYQFGGVAVPDNMFGSVGYGRQLHPRDDLIISAAGPGVQLLLAALVVLLVSVAGHEIFGTLASTLILILPFQDVANALMAWAMQDQNPPLPYMLGEFVGFMLLVNILWPLFNLLPIYPLDGGRIARDLCAIFNVRDGLRMSLWLSLLTAGAVAAWALSGKNYLMALMFGMLAYGNYQYLQSFTGRGGYGGGRPW